MRGSADSYAGLPLPPASHAFNGALTISSMDAATDTITTAFNHGLANGQVVKYTTSGTVESGETITCVTPAASPPAK